MCGFANSFRYSEESHGKQVSSANSLAVGYDTGALAAAAIALSPALSTLVPLAVQICLIAFRLGRHARMVAGLLECNHQDEGHSIWSDLVAETTESNMRDTLELFNIENVRYPLFFLR